MAALAGLVQEEPADVKQFGALRALASSCEQDAQTVSAKSLTSAFEAPYWQERVKAFWECAVDEVVIGPQMSEVMVKLNRGSREETAEARRITTSSYEHWVAK